jgi:hypothetical protein
VDGCQVTAAVESGKHHRVETIGLSTVTGFARNERWCNDIAVETVPGEHPLKNEAGAGGLVTGPHGPSLGQTAKQATDLHEITGKFYHFGLPGVTFEDGSSDRIQVDIETGPYILIHGWIPPRKREKA